MQSLWTCACRAIACAALGSTLLAGAGCAGNNEPAPRARTVAPNVRDVPSALRGTVGSVARLRGVQAVRVSGIGFVVGLDGTGGLPLQDQFAATLERQMALNGIGTAGTYEGTPIDGITPRQLLADRNTAAVIVEAAIPPGSRPGDTLDIYVRALNATSLEGGRLWTTELRLGPPSSFGGPAARVVGQARGPIFINPFAEPGANATDAVVRTVGRVLDGGVSTDTFFLEVVLDTPSHARARQIVSSINSRFPPEARVGEVARGLDDAVVRVRVPRAYENRRGEFAELVRHIQIDQSFPEVYARRYTSTLRSQPGLANQMSYSLQALGERALPFIRDLYEFPEAQPRLAALRAGARLGDARAAPPLMELAQSGPQNLRTDAIQMLSRLDAGPRVDQALRGMLEDPALSVRVEAYEGLAWRAERVQRVRLARSNADRTPGQRLNNRGLENAARMELPRGTLQGVSRSFVEGRFLLDRVPVGDPLIYITQQGEPRIALFGDPELARLQTPLLVTAWSDRLMLISDGPGDPIRLYYRDDRSGRVVVTEDAPTDLGELIAFMARTPRPEDPRPALGLSYAELVGALYEIQNQGGTRAAFATEQDRLLADLLDSRESETIELRPETPDDDSDLVILKEFDDPTRPITPVRPGERPAPGSLLVPLTPQAPPADGEGGDAGDGAAASAPARPASEDEPAGRPE
ncbi:MAG: flagellar basal body P-ring protein FlgI [Planctomycetota bacterium]